MTAPKRILIYMKRAELEEMYDTLMGGRSRVYTKLDPANPDRPLLQIALECRDDFEDGDAGNFVALEGEYVANPGHPFYDGPSKSAS